MPNSSSLPLFVLNLTLKPEKPGAFENLVTRYKAISGTAQF